MTVLRDDLERNLRVPGESILPPFATYLPFFFFLDLPFEWDLERAIDDFVLLCFLVGNDFLPHLPTLSIRDGAIDLLTNLYKKLLPVTGWLTAEGGEVHVSKLKVFLKVI